MHIRLKIISLLSLLTSFQALADWEVDQNIDPFTDIESKSLTYTGEYFEIYMKRTLSKHVWMGIKMNDSRQFSHEGQVDYRVDKNKPHNASLARSRKLEKLIGPRGQTFIWQPSEITFLVWHGGESEGDSCGIINEIANGNQIAIRYPVSRVRAETLLIDIEGISDKMIDAFDLVSCPSD